MRIMAICIAVLLYSLKSKAQVEPGELTTLFAFQVNGIDDFFERFDFKKNTSFQNFVKKNYEGYELTRKKIIANLFNLKNVDLNIADINDFISCVADSIHPQFMKYRDKDWYAELRCKVFYKNQPKKLTLILKVEQSAQNTFRWSVASVRADFLNYKHSKVDSNINSRLNEALKSDTIRSTKYFLSPVSHGLDFMDIDNVFINKTHVNDYIYFGPRSFELNKLILQIQKSEIKFVQVNSIRYHLLQVDGWVLTVDYFERNEMNSGWLVSKLVKSDEKQKEEYLLSKLNVLK
ncbi:MAG: hypothetical protein ABI855_09085 [Bacteroidota bacterium]